MKENYLETNAHLNLVLLGRTGAGKSLSGNTILGRQAFISRKSSKSVTQDVAVESGTVGGLPVTVYDTPGLFDTELNEEEIKQKLENVLQKCESGSCAFLLVIKADRFTEEERKTVEKIEKLLGQSRLNETWILFTRGDELVDENMTIQEFLDETEQLKELVQKYDWRYHVFNNKAGSSDQARLLLANIIQRSLKLKVTEGGRPTRQNPDIRNSAPEEQQTTAVNLSSRRIVLLGKTGVGKSAAGNTIVGQKVFESELNMSSVTRKCSEKHAIVLDRSLLVVDTPGLFDTHMKPEDIIKEMARSVYISSPGPHAFLIVLPVNMRFNEQEQQIPQMTEILFGQEVLKYSIILFTHGDQLEEKSIKKLIKSNPALRHLVQECGGRFHVFNNKDLNDRKQVNDLLQKIDTMIEQNGGGHYSNEMFEEALRFRCEEEEIRQREEKQRKLQKEKQRQEEIERVRKETEERVRAELEVQMRSKVDQSQSDVSERKETQKQKPDKIKRIGKVKLNTQIQQDTIVTEAEYGFKFFFDKFGCYFSIASLAIRGSIIGCFIGAITFGFSGGISRGDVGAVLGAAAGGIVGAAAGAAGAAGGATAGAVLSEHVGGGAVAVGTAAGVADPLSAGSVSSHFSVKLIINTQ